MATSEVLSIYPCCYCNFVTMRKLHSDRSNKLPRGVNAHSSMVGRIGCRGEKLKAICAQNSKETA